MRISHKLILGFLLVATVASLSIFFTLRSYKEINASFDKLMNDPMPMIGALNHMKQAGIRIVSSTSEYGFIHNEAAGLDAAGDAKEEGEEEQLLEAAYRSFDTWLKRLEELAHNDATVDATMLPNIRSSGNKLIKTSGEIIELKKRNISGREVLEKKEVFENDERAFLKTVDDALEFESAQQIDLHQNVQTTIANSTERTLIVGLSTFIVAIFSGLFISFSLSRRIRKLKNASRRVGLGELDTWIEMNSGDEIGDLSRSFNKMIGDLKESRADLATREQHFRSIIENSSDAIALFGADGATLYASPSTPQVIGYTPDEMIGVNAADLIPADDQEIFKKRLGELANQPGATVDLVNRFRHKDGSFRWLEGTFTNLLHEPHVTAIVSNYRDITDRKRAEAEHDVIYKIIQGVAITANLDELLELIHRSIGRVLYAENCYVALYDRQTDLISVPFCIDKYDTVAPPVKLGTGLTAYVLKKGQPMLMTPEVIRELTESGEVAAVGTDPAIWLGVPLRTPEGIIGAFVVQHYEDEKAYDRQDLEFLTSVGDQIAIAIERKKAEDESVRLNAEIASQGERLTTIISNVRGVVWETKTKMEKGETLLRIDFVSNYIETMLGYSAEECLAQPEFWLDIIHPDDRERTEQIVRAIFAGGKDGTVEFRWIAKDGHEVWIESRSTIVHNDAGKTIGLRGIAVDITERKSFEKQLTYQTLHDPLTKLANRVLFLDRVEHAVDRTARQRSPVTVLFLDLDNFKSVNDSLGHAAGDELLILVTERLQGCLRPSDTPARLGGDEFAILIEDIQQEGDAGAIAERIRLVLSAPFSISGTEVFISASIGMATRINEHETPEELIRNADVAMYKSKSNGKDQCTVFESEMHDVLIRRLRMESDMRTGIEAREFEVYYQPIIDLQTEHVMGIEALVRWNHPEHGLIPPLDFIPLAEETGLIIPLGKWILEEACTQASAWQAKYGFNESLSITVNVASRQFFEDGLLEMVESALAKSKLLPGSLVLEITESTMLLNTEATVRTLTALKSLGIRLAIDDFGTGYSSLSYLQRFPVDILKIDKSFVDQIASGKEGAAVAKAIITMSEALHLRTIAEGIESESQQTELQNLGCELGQGYLFAKPLRKTDMNEFLRISALSENESLSVVSAPTNRVDENGTVML